MATLKRTQTSRADSRANKRENGGGAGQSRARAIRRDKGVREAVSFYAKATKRPDIRGILEDLAKP